MKSFYTDKGLPGISIILIILAILIPNRRLNAQIYLDSTKTVEERVNDLISRMTLQEKIGQMAQAEQAVLKNNQDVKNYFLGSVTNGGGSSPYFNTPEAWADMIDNFQAQALQTRLKIPIIYGLDAVHGHNNLKGAVMFPHNIGLGCTRDSLLVFRAAQMAAKEVAASGPDWTFAPCIAAARDERWGRTYESISEDPALVSRLGSAIIKGFQGNALSSKSILATAKHFIGDGGTTGGIDQGNTQMDEQTLRNLFLPPYREAVKSGVGAVMASYSSWNGQKVHGSKYLLTTLLKGELGFKGFIISDWNAITQLTGDSLEQYESAINAGIDMVMLPYKYKEFTATLKILAEQGRVPIARIDDAVKRILRIKFTLGLFEHPYTDRTLANEIGSDAHRQIARELVRKSLVLLKRKDNVLPLKKNGMKIHLAGKNADNLGYQCGGWSISWQGSGGDITTGTTILEAVRNTVSSSQVTYSLDGLGAAGADIGVAVIGETPYAEGSGDSRDLALSTEDISTVRNLKAAGIPVVVILITGRPVILAPILHFADAVVAAWLPGTEGQGAADILFGDFAPSGRLSFSWPKDITQVPVNYGDAFYSPLWPYGYGIGSYSNPPAGSSPVLTSAAVSNDGSIAEATFNKAMADPKAEAANFTLLRVSGTGSISITKAELKYKDSTTVLLYLSPMIRKGELLTLSYKEGGLRSSDGGKLKAFSGQEVYNVLNEKNVAFSVPGRVEAEFYNAMYGIDLQACADSGGGQNVGWIHDNDWLDYLLDVPSQGVYNISLRAAAMASAGRIKLITAGSASHPVIDIPVTGGWQNWVTLSAALPLLKGLQTLRLLAVSGGFNINWLEFAPPTGAAAGIVQPVSYSLFQNYPNPFNNSTLITYDIPQAGKVEIKLYDILGSEVLTLIDKKEDPGRHMVRLEAGALKSGIYFYRIRTGSFIITRKLMLLK